MQNSTSRKNNKNAHVQYGDTWFRSTMSEKDLGIVDQKLNMSHQCDVAAKKVNAVFKML